MPPTLLKGTIEYLVVVIADRLNNVTDLDNINATYTVFGNGDDEEEPVIDGEEAETDGMSIICLIDTTNLDEGNYRMVIDLDGPSPQTPRLGPFKFDVEDCAND